MTTETPLALALLWEAIADDLLDRTAKFPKASRYSIASRVDNLVIDVLEGLVEARYTAGGRRQDVLQDLNLRLSRLRVLLRLANRRGYLLDKGYEHVSERINDAGRMLGGWMRSLKPGRGRGDEMDG